MDGTRLRRVSLRIRPPKEDVLLAQSEVEYDIAGFVFVGVGYMARERVLVAEPLGEVTNDEMMEGER